MSDLFMQSSTIIKNIHLRRSATQPNAMRPNQPNPPQVEKSRPNPTQPNPTQANPWIDPTHGQLWFQLPRRQLDVNFWHYYAYAVDGQFVWFKQ